MSYGDAGFLIFWNADKGREISDKNGLLNGLVFELGSNNIAAGLQDRYESAIWQDIVEGF